MPKPKDKLVNETYRASRISYFITSAVENLQAMHGFQITNEKCLEMLKEEVDRRLAEERIRS